MERHATIGAVPTRHTNTNRNQRAESRTGMRLRIFVDGPERKKRRRAISRVVLLLCGSGVRDLSRDCLFDSKKRRQAGIRKKDGMERERGTQKDCEEEGREEEDNDIRRMHAQPLMGLRK